MTDDDGSAALEFITVGLILLIPLVYLVLALGVIQQQTLGVEAAARHIARTVAGAPDAVTGERRAERALAAIVETYDLDEDAVEVEFTCAPAGTDCPVAGSIVVVTVSTVARLPFVPPVLGLDSAAAIPIEASGAQKVSRRWGGGG
ncbi:ATP:cob(I)alamin adenosyltransferase [Streptomyces sp. AC495_CC817]|uniref:ATP:cob(I)alamin adenosyltransferase n=1 Tax=Streptomyces sp. AC495_CC817 TaxID=2823900 RepID=UPI001C255F16|nr:ATP:cob(I)alamin adenosyltransferase [Streptomyces sp. AC495_CC817]